MILEFTVKNFLSIKDEVTLSMVASKDSSFEDNLLPYEDGKKIKNALKSVVIYGANASGKSNVLKALKFFSWFINKSHEMQQGRKIPRNAFKLDRNCIDEPSEFQIIFIHKNIKYLYGFSVTEEEVIEEYLYYYPNGRQSTIFDRKKDEYTFTIDVERQTELKNKFHSKNKLFIATESLWEYEKAKIPFEWLSNYLNIFINHDKLEGYTGSKMHNDEKINVLVKKYIKLADVGIDNVDIKLRKAQDILSSDLYNVIPDDAKAEILNKIQDRDVLDIKMIHSIEDESGNIINYKFDLNEESDGTQKFFGLLGPWVDALLNGYTIVIDELDIRLHTLLVKKLIQMFLDPEINKNNAQLIFSTHDTNLLDSDLLRRDQVWFTEKKEDKSTDLYSLYDFRGVRKNVSIEKGYLQGKYGAIPVLKGDWQWD
ncbi:AAA family ATPase [Clostridium weizhouense]|uniref:ATP-binding protein n=1 Tax=Clostridium weizhouense TaxID=2859781 RepID=A0ABS7AST8_9CLOT|nr:ATP-binding protein [Clostridium weizhouense]MBW6411672.1 ATP-binding protein [Clostridium weizhouense]